MFSTDDNISSAPVMRSPQQREKKRSLRLPWNVKKCAVIVAALVTLAAAWLLLPLDNWINAIRQWIAHLGDWGLAAFMLMYIVAVVLLIPGAALTITAGLTYGWWGLAISLVAATTGASLAFLIGRYLARARVRSFIADHTLLQAVTRAVSAEGWKVVGLVRLSPLIPFNLQNYFFGVTDIPFLHYALATLIGMIPGTFVNIYIAIFGSSMFADDGKLTLVQWGFFAFGLAVTVLVTWMVARRARRELIKVDVPVEG